MGGRSLGTRLQIDTINDMKFLCWECFPSSYYYNLLEYCSAGPTLYILVPVCIILGLCIYLCVSLVTCMKTSCNRRVENQWSNPQTINLPLLELESGLKCVSGQGEHSVNQKKSHVFH